MKSDTIINDFGAPQGSILLYIYLLYTISTTYARYTR